MVEGDGFKSGKLDNVFFCFEYVQIGKKQHPTLYHRSLYRTELFIMHMRLLNLYGESTFVDLCMYVRFFRVCNGAWRGLGIWLSLSIMVIKFHLSSHFRKFLSNSLGLGAYRLWLEVPKILFIVGIVQRFEFRNSVEILSKYPQTESDTLFNC